MFKNFFKKEKKENSNDKNILIIALLIHAARIDENYTEIEKKIIKKTIIQLKGEVWIGRRQLSYLISDYSRRLESIIQTR